MEVEDVGDVVGGVDCVVAVRHVDGEDEGAVAEAVFVQDFVGVVGAEVFLDGVVDVLARVFGVVEREDVDGAHDFWVVDALEVLLELRLVSWGEQAIGVGQLQAWRLGGGGDRVVCRVGLVDGCVGARADAAADQQGRRSNAQNL